MVCTKKKLVASAFFYYFFLNFDRSAGHARIPFGCNSRCLSMNMGIRYEFILVYLLGINITCCVRHDLHWVTFLELALSQSRSACTR